MAVAPCVIPPECDQAFPDRVLKYVVEFFGKISSADDVVEGFFLPYCALAVQFPVDCVCGVALYASCDVLDRNDGAVHNLGIEEEMDVVGHHDSGHQVILSIFIEAAGGQNDRAGPWWKRAA